MAILIKDMLVNNRYKIIECIGNNSIGASYSALDVNTQQKVVVKELSDSNVIQLYTRLAEIEPLEGIVSVLDIVTEDNITYGIMEYVKGVTLHEYLSKSSAKFKVQRIKDLLKPVASSLLMLSNADIHHGNISLDNMIFTQEGKLKLIGFGQINGVISEKTKGYASPEMYNNAAIVSDATDVYSLCALIYKCITSIDLQEACDRKNLDLMRKPSELGIEIEPAAEAVIMMGMNIDINRRLIKMVAFYRAFFDEDAPMNQIKFKPKKQSVVNTYNENISIPLVNDNVIKPVVEQNNAIEDNNNDDKTELVIENTPASDIDDDKTEIVMENTPLFPTDDDKTEIINASEDNLNAIRNVAPIANDFNQHENAVEWKEENIIDKSAVKESKKGNIILIIIIVIGVGIAAVLGYFTFKLAMDYLNGGEISESSEIFSGKGNESSDNDSDSEEETEAVGDVIAAMVAEGNLEEAVNYIIDNEVDAEAGKDSLKSIVDELYSQCVNETNALAKSGDLDIANSIIDGRIQFFKEIASKTGYLDDTHENDLNNQKNQIMVIYVDGLYSQAEKYVAQGNQQGLDDVISKLSGNVSEDELRPKREEYYTNMVLVGMIQMRTENKSDWEIRKYIDDNLSKTGNNCRLIEFWNYYDDLYAKSQNRSRMKVTSIRTTSGYILPYSNFQEITNSDISHLSQYELYFALFEIYARHGRIFTDTAVSEQFRKFSWYTPTTSPESFNENSLSDIERKNIDTILNYQKAMGYRD